MSMFAEYGQPLTEPDWVSPSLRAGDLPGQGHLDELCAAGDVVLLWSGGSAEVTIESAHRDSPETSTKHTFTRHSGMVDLLPRGTLLQRVVWRGASQSCVSVNVPRIEVDESGQQVLGLDPQQGPRFGLLDPHLADLAQRLHLQTSTGQPLGSAYVRALSLTLAAYVSARYGVAAVQSSPPPASLSRVLVQQLGEFVEEHLGEDVGLTDLAKVAGYSPDHFARLFKRSFGVTPYQYLTTRRIERAKLLMADRSRSLAEIAVACGFANQAHFSTVFRRHTGSTPGGHRRS